MATCHLQKLCLPPEVLGWKCLLTLELTSFRLLNCLHGILFNFLFFKREIFSAILVYYTCLQMCNQYKKWDAISGFRSVVKFCAKECCNLRNVNSFSWTTKECYETRFLFILVSMFCIHMNLKWPFRFSWHLKHVNSYFKLNCFASVGQILFHLDIFLVNDIPSS